MPSTSSPPASGSTSAPPEPSRLRGSAIAAAIRSTMERAISGVRIVSAAYCVSVFARHSGHVAHPALGWAVMAAVLAWTVFAVWVQLSRGTGRSDHAAGATFAIIDVAVVLALTLLTIAVQTQAQRSGQLPTLTTVWAVCPALTAGARRGIVAGLIAAALQGAASIVVRDGADANTLTNIVMLLIAGTATGYLAQLASRAEAEAVAAASAAAAQQAAIAERERLARDIHDGVLQVLSLVHRRGAELGGDAAELGRLAGEQEEILRGLVSRPAPTASDGNIDLAEACVLLRRADVTVSVPAHPVLLPAPLAHEVLGAARSALNNVARHAGAGAQAWVLLEDDEDRLVLSIRDDGVGVTAERLAEAAAANRMGVAQSILKRIADAGGVATVGPAPGGGTEVELTVPLTLPLTAQTAQTAQTARTVMEERA